MTTTTGYIRDNQIAPEAEYRLIRPFDKARGALERKSSKRGSTIVQAEQVVVSRTEVQVYR